MIQKKMMKLAYFLIMGLVIGCSHHNSQKMTKTDDKLNLSIHKYVLDNGLRVLIHENKKLPILSYYTFFDVGGRYEEEGTTGATHFLEHMMFKGAKKYGPGALYSYIESNGGSINAYTSFDDTVYYQTAPSHALEKIIDIESDRLQHLLLDPALFKKEKQIILEERKMRYENSDRGKLYQQMMKEVFKGTPYGGSVIGEKKDVINLKRDQMMDFFKRFYTPDNAIIVISGDVNAENAIRMIKKKYGHIKRSQDLEEFKKIKDSPSRYQFQRKFGKTIYLHGQSKNPKFMIAYKGVPIGTRKGFVLDVLASILGQSDSSFLNEKWVTNKRPKLSSIYSANYTLKNSGVFFIGGELLQKVSLKKFKKDYDKMTRSICSNAITKRSVQKTKNQYLVHYYGQVQTNSNVAQFIGNNEFYYDDYAHYNKELDIIEGLTVEEIKKECKSIFKNNKNVFVSIWQKHPKRK